MKIPITRLQDFIEMREQLGMTAAEVSERLGKPGHIEKVEAGELPYKHIYFMALLGYVLPD